MSDEKSPWFVKGAAGLMFLLLIVFIAILAFKAIEWAWSL